MNNSDIPDFGTHIDDSRVDLSSSHTSSLADLLRVHVPQAYADGLLNIDELLRALGANSGSVSKYQLQWTGKDDAVRAQQVLSYGSLHPDIQASVKFDEAENVFIEGDNLEVLRLLQRAYNDRVKLIYIDPPYNTTNDFVYNDDFTDSLDTYLRYTKQRDEDGNMTSATAESGGRRHSGWLTMMYPRLALAKNLLRSDGAIFVSIDDIEVHNLRQLLDLTFGPENFVGQFVWAAGRKNDSKFVSASHQYIVCYARNIVYLKEHVGEWRTRKDGLEAIYAEHKKLLKKHKTHYAAVETDLKAWYKSLPANDPSKRHKHYSSVDSRGIYFPDNISFPNGGGPTFPVIHPKTGKSCKVPSGGWRFTTPVAMQAQIDDDRIHFGQDESTIPCRKSYLKEHENEVPYSVFYQDGRAATNRLEALLGGSYFENPKDELVLQRIVEFASDKESIVLDFFAGSGTTAHAVMLQNAADGGKRKFILVNLPEEIDHKEKPQAKAAKLNTISDITQLRLKKAASEIGVKDFSLKCLKLGMSNFKIWDPTKVGDDAASIATSLTLFKDSLRDGSTDDAIALELLLKEGIPLGTPWKRIKIAETNAIQAGSVVVSLSRSVNKSFVESILQVDGMTKLLMLDEAFEHNDQHKANLLIKATELRITVRTA
jgi:adenine-specific DNA-methyltransferase